MLLIQIIFHYKIYIILIAIETGVNVQNIINNLWNKVKMKFALRAGQDYVRDTSFPFLTRTFSLFRFCL